MSLTFTYQDITTANCDYICHQVNCKGKMNSGVAKAIREKWPVVFDNYKTKIDTVGYQLRENFLGTIQIVPLYENYKEDERHQCVINMFAQNDYGYDGKRYTSYDAFWNCLNLIAHHVPKGSKIAFPCYIGCGRGGANWNVIKEMIDEVLGQDFTVVIFMWEEE